MARGSLSRRNTSHGSDEVGKTLAVGLLQCPFGNLGPRHAADGQEARQREQIEDVDAEDTRRLIHKPPEKGSRVSLTVLCPEVGLQLLHNL